ncbi:MAG: DUF6456 domain-containing protein [Pseudomonadota bacterium]
MTNTVNTFELCTDRVRSVFPEAPAGTVARDTALYLAHTEQGESIRALASAVGSHPSTVMRAVRRVEDRRDDPLFDRLLDPLQDRTPAHVARAAAPEPARAEPVEAPAALGPAPAACDEADLRRHAKTALRRLGEPGAFLLIAPGTEKGGIFCSANQHSKPIAMIPVRIAVEFARRDWIRLETRGSATARYRLGDPGRAALKRILAEDLAARQPAGFAEAQAPFLAQHRIEGERILTDTADGAPVRLRVNLGESPLGWLAKRKGPDGTPFLTREEVEAGDRLRADFDAAQIGPSVTQDWSRFLAPVDCGSGGRGGSSPDGPTAPRERVTAALAALGPGLSDVALRVCCFLEGLEACEKRMGWSARSGKVVLKIALQRLVEHYGLAQSVRDKRGA